MTVKKIANCNNVNSVNPLYLMINEMIGHFEEKSGNKYLVLDDVMKIKKFQKNIKKLGKALKKRSKRLMVAKTLNTGNIKKKNRFESNDDLPKNKPIKRRLLKIIIRFVFSEGGKFYPHFFR